MPIVTLFSDFGFEDGSVAIAKGILLQHIPDANIIDICHSSEPFNKEQAAYIFNGALPGFPPATIHLVLFDLYSDLLVTVTSVGGHYIIGPGSQIVNPELMAGSVTRLYQGQEPIVNFAEWMHTAAFLARKVLENNSFADSLPIHTSRAFVTSAPTFASNEINCSVIYVDGFENVVLNIRREQFEKIRDGRSFQILFSRLEEITEIVEQYSAVRPGYRLCRFNSAGYLEIAINQGNAASLFGLRAGNNNSKAKILFE